MRYSYQFETKEDLKEAFHRYLDNTGQSIGQAAMFYNIDHGAVRVDPVIDEIIEERKAMGKKVF